MKVIRVIDADTICVEMHVRLAGIDAPRKGTPEGEAASAFVRDQVLGKDVEIKWYFPEAMYNRPVAEVVNKKTRRNLGDDLVSMGLATYRARPRTAMVIEEEMEALRQEKLRLIKSEAMKGDL